MSYYDLDKKERTKLSNSIKSEIFKDLKASETQSLIKYFSDKDTYIRKVAYNSIRDIILLGDISEGKVIKILNSLYDNKSELVRQTVVNSLGEIGKFYPEKVIDQIEKALFDNHSKVRNAVIGSLKKFGAIHPKYVIDLAKKYYNHENVEVRRIVIHGLELRGRTHPEDILDTLELAQFDSKSRIRNMVEHVLIQISYKKGSLGKVLNHIKNWQNKELIQKTVNSIMQKHIIDEHFTYYSPKEALKVIQKIFPDFTYKITQMNIIDELAYTKGEKGEEANIELAEKISKEMDIKAVSQLVETLETNSNSSIQNNCIKVLYEIGERKPQLISKYTDLFIDLLKSKQNRLVWGAMTALAIIADRKHLAIWERINEIIDAFENGSVITQDEGTKVLVTMSSKKKIYEEKISPILLEKIKKDRPKDIAKDVEIISKAVNERNKNEFLKTIEERKSSLSDSQLKRVERVLKKLG
jgi:HEAT repeat protein